MPLVTRQTNQSFIYKSDTQPANWSNGDVWINISDSPPPVYVNDNDSLVLIGLAPAIIFGGD